ncbi:hypothetical protein M2152_002137 [Microbacteriaceae bacterium SG_E_30_P1]|uniref:DUF998 domain-containing protein n=1 Tax=Antiquaquibacter oligotrophicus TaxID=2880260 RepID=A0ABT6KPP1_9MICO|nr:DUF998 domain-containing protein [Antiquaquibacter oligotrophicus]MDH6181955.1 hypothetical protein [Antiquaquibacter oligotrophicus]UDF12375.1 DUF998 domain-containing protein [Antiquaquibacter oligotrophicus]
MRRAEFAAAVLGSLAVTVALAIIWMSRLTVPRELYVSELGAEGEPTAAAFEVALLLIVAGGSAVAWAGRRVRASARVLSAWTPAVSLWIGCAFFLLASQVTCTAGCPLPYGPSFTWQDFTHTLAAVIAFAAACWAMLQTSFARETPLLARLSLATAVLVAVIAGTGGLFSLFRFQVELGSRMEFVATTIAIAWLVVFGVILALRSARGLALKQVEQPTG